MINQCYLVFTHIAISILNFITVLRISELVVESQIKLTVTDSDTHPKNKSKSLRLQVQFSHFSVSQSQSRAFLNFSITAPTSHSALTLSPVPEANIMIVLRNILSNRVVIL